MASENPTMALDPKYDHYDYPTTAPMKQSGHPGHLTPEQEAQVYQLRMMLEQRGYTERLDTLTLVMTQQALELRTFADMQGSYDFWEHENLMLSCQSKCQLRVHETMQRLWALTTDMCFKGLSIARTGGKNSISTT